MLRLSLRNGLPSPNSSLSNWKRQRIIGKRSIAELKPGLKRLSKPCCARKPRSNRYASGCSAKKAKSIVLSLLPLQAERQPPAFREQRMSRKRPRAGADNSLVHRAMAEPTGRLYRSSWKTLTWRKRIDPVRSAAVCTSRSRPWMRSATSSKFRCKRIAAAFAGGLMRAGPAAAVLTPRP